MPIQITWYGHATWLIETGDHKILLDPFLDDNPASPIKAEDVEVDTVLVSHGHFDHIADAASIANRNGAKLVANYEVAQWLAANHNVQEPVDINPGGEVEMPWGLVKMVPAVHSSGLPDGSYGGVAAGFVLTINELKIYFACDTALFGDMNLIGDMDIHLAVLPIGDRYTMGLADSVKAAQLVNAKQVLPSHYNTWPPIEQDATAWSEMIHASTDSTPIVLEPGETHTV